jgi:hypothetical protein
VLTSNKHRPSNKWWVIWDQLFCRPETGCPLLLQPTLLCKPQHSQSRRTHPHVTLVSLLLLPMRFRLQLPITPYYRIINSIYTSLTSPEQNNTVQPIIMSAFIFLVSKKVWNDMLAELSTSNFLAILIGTVNLLSQLCTNVLFIDTYKSHYMFRLPPKPSSSASRLEH